MHDDKISRRAALSRTGVAFTAALFAGELGAAVLAEEKPNARNRRPFLFCLNTATIRGQKLPIDQEVATAAKAGYDSIEPWVSSIEEYIKSGGKLADLRQQLSDVGMTVESAIGFPEWLVDDDTRRARGLEQAKRDMELVAQIGGKRLAAPPVGATDYRGMEIAKAADRYRTLLEIGDQAGVVPQLELWGFSKCMGQLSECVATAMQTGHPRACVLADVYHLYKGGSEYRGIHLLNSSAIQVLHMNDYPADPPREKVDDSYRVYPGDGVAPLTNILSLLRDNGGEVVLSLEVFNRKYWAEDALTVAKTGLARMKSVVDKLPAQKA
jgi:sugar phosphate isomerase/epimerase